MVVLQEHEQCLTSQAVPIFLFTYDQLSKVVAVLLPFLHSSPRPHHIVTHPICHYERTHQSTFD
jgi:hypothetical protein